MKKLLTLVAIFIAIFTNAQVALHGLYTPVRLNFDTTHIYLRDYLADMEFSEVRLPDGLANHSNGKDTLILTGSLPVKMATLAIETVEGRKDLVLIKSAEREITIRIPSSIGAGGDLRIIAAFNNWNRESEPLQLIDGAYEQTYRLSPGTYEYKLYLNGKELLDPTNAEKVSNGMGSFNNVLRVDNKSNNLPTPIHAGSSPYKGSLEVVGAVDSNHHVFALWNNELVFTARVKTGKDSCFHTIFYPHLKAEEIKRSFIRVFSYQGEQICNDIIIPLEHGKPVSDVSQLDRSDWHQARMYFLMVDRFNNGDAGNDLKTPDDSINDKANYYGGDLSGVDQKVKDGFFDSLHVNTIWLSPITQNPLDAWGLWDKGVVTSKFSGYHGYWPISNVKVDFRFGSEKEVKTLLDNAHSNNKNVILDYVANHVHLQHPIYQKNKNWATSLYLPDGTKNTERWDEHRLTTWFDDHLPTLDLSRWEVVDPMVDSALFWVTNYSFDGFRHDATKHIDELYWRTLTYRVRTKTDQPIFQIGETYGSPQLINSYIGTGLLDAQFDFNLYDAAVSAFANKEGSLEQLKYKLEQGLSVYGHHHLMGNITGNQDRSRFITLSSGDVKFTEDQKLAGWDREIGKPSAEAYKRLALLHAFNNAIPGIPCIYYGDEYGMPGAGDPDNRRMMKFDGLDEDERELLEKVKELNAARASHLPLIYGSTVTFIAANKLLVISRRYFDQLVVVVINPANHEQGANLEFDNTTGFVGTKILGEGELSSFQDYVHIKIPALSYQYFLFEKSNK